MTSASASSISRNVSQETVRISRRSPCSSSYGHVRSASAISSSAASQRSSVGRVERLAGEREQADAVGHLLPHERHRHHEVLVCPQARDATAAARRRRAARPAASHGSPASRRSAAPPRRIAALLLARAQGAELEEELGLRADRRVVRRVGAVEHLLGRGLGEQRAYVEGVPERRVEADVRVAAARSSRADRRSRSGRARPARRGCARAARRGRAPAAARRGPCGRASARLARRPARRRRPARGARSRSPAGSCGA